MSRSARANRQSSTRGGRRTPEPNPLVHRSRRVRRTRRTRGRRRGRARGADTRRRRAIAGKTVIDACNPIGGGPPVNGVLSFFTTPHDSLMERLQKAYPRPISSRRSTASARGKWSIRISPPAVRRCSSAAKTPAAKTTVTNLLDQFGWDTEDMGAVEAARAIEPLCMLWCIPASARATGRRMRSSCCAEGKRAPKRRVRPKKRPKTAPMPLAWPSAGAFRWSIPRDANWRRFGGEMQ